MPATEQTWRDSKLLHVVFGVTSLIMLVATVWMLAADHTREWKNFQRRFDDVETWTAKSRLQQTQNDTYRTELTGRENALQIARQAVPSAGQVTRFKELVNEDLDRREKAQQKPLTAADFSKLDAAYAALQRVPQDERPAQRDRMLDAMRGFSYDARLREDDLSRGKKESAAEFDVARSQYEIAIGNHDSTEQISRFQEDTDKIKAQLDELSLNLQDASTYRKALESIVAEITADETTARKAIDDHTLAVKRLEDTRDERERSWGKWLLEQPIIDAFGRPLKIDNIWLPKLTINNNFRDVARFDRCTTCHRALDKTAPGSAVEPAYKPIEMLTVKLTTPGKAPEPLEGQDGPMSAADQLKAAYGMQLAPYGLVKDNDVTISVVRPEGLAAKARLAMGDVITKIGDKLVLRQQDVYAYLVENVNWGSTLDVTVRRGLPNPFTSHPRLDLFVGSLSPHKLNDVGCTICHEGQGSGTEFKWASHSPNSPAQADAWRTDYGWFNNHHWIFPMNPKRFAESSCLKCHHEVDELEPSERFPDPPAPTLVAGYQTIRQYGCFGCHEINGYDGPNRRIGPDLRAEPNYSAAAQALLAKTDLLNPQQQSWAQLVAREPADSAARHSLQRSLIDAAVKPADADADKQAESDESTRPAPAKLDASVTKLVNLLDDVETPGKLRKVGPSLRHVASKVDYDFLYSWIRRPKDFRPNTKMPQFFGLTEHLEGKGLETSERFEPLEIRGVVEYLLAKSQKFEFAELPKEDPSAERGKKLFQTRGCLACHQHKDFPDSKMTQGPDLSNVGGKLGRKANPNGAKWLYSWLRDPSRYHPRTLMPNLLLDPLPGEGGKLTNPADDLAAYLFSSRDWQPENIPSRELSADQREALDDLALDHMKAVFTRKQAVQYLEQGIPASRAAELKGDEIELVGEMSVDKKLQYIGRRTISKYGCFGCHDIPGYEDVKPIGTGLADWGRKSADKLAFEQIAVYLTEGHGAAKGHSAGHENTADDHAVPAASTAGHELNYADMDPDTGFYLEKLMHHERTGFIWQKLRAPRSYDYKKAANKGYNERLRMPQFNFNSDQIEEVITFVLGLVAEPPALQYVAKPTPRRQTIIEGRMVLEKYNCGGCHLLEMDRWNLAYQPSDFNDPPPIKDYPQLIPHATPQQIKESLAVDTRGLRHATITGLGQVNPETGLPLMRDEDGAPIEAGDTESAVFYPVMLWENAFINGKVRQAGVQDLTVPAKTIEKAYPSPSGYLTRMLYSVVVADEKKLNPNAKAEEAWGWLPPPLAREGTKVQSNWVHDFLLDPFPIRPAVVLRMPKFNMSSAEASTLANYFAAVDNVNYPYNFDARTRQDYLAVREKDHPERLADALKIITDNNYCIKCHLVGDWAPTGSDRAKGPHLDQVYKRLRPEYLWPYIANPKRLIPYTGMPVNVPYDKPVSQDLYHGTSEQQVDGLVDFLLNYDRYTESQTKIRAMIKTPPAAAGTDNNSAAN